MDLLSLLNTFDIKEYDIIEVEVSNISGYVLNYMRGIKNGILKKHSEQLQKLLLKELKIEKNTYNKKVQEYRIKAINPLYR